MKKTVIAAIVLGTTAASAFAADMGGRAPYTKAPIAQVYDWSGFYVGGDVGGQWSNIGISSPDPLATLGYNARHDSFAAGGHAGYQHQWGQFVLGIEGAYTAAFGQPDRLATPAIRIFFPGGTGTASAKLRDIWSVGGRVGWAPNNWLVYATGGYASGSFAFDAASGTTTPLVEHASARPDGFYIGGGVEYAVAQNWIVGLEYRHYEFNAKAVTGVISGSFGTAVEPVKFEPKTDVVMGRLSYRFNWATPVVAKY
jgi:outer membrane immunogenic protein